MVNFLYVQHTYVLSDIKIVLPSYVKRLFFLENLEEEFILKTKMIEAENSLSKIIFVL